MTIARPQFERIRARARRGIWLETFAWIAIATLGFTFFSYGVDRWLRLEVAYRAVLLAIFVGAIAIIVQRRMLRPMRFQLTDDELALAVERQDTELQQSLISAVQFRRGLGDEEAVTRSGESAQMMGHVVGDVERRIDALPFAQAIDGKRVGKAVGTVAAAAIILGSWALVFSEEARLWASRNLGLSGAEWPRSTMLTFVDAGNDGDGVRIAERDDLTVRVQAAGVVPDGVELHCVFESGETIDRPMERIGEDSFTITLDTLLENVTVHATGGDGLTEDLSITLVPRPRVRDLTVNITFPSYLNREAETIEDLGKDIVVPRGSLLTVMAKSDKPLQSATLRHGDDVQVDASLSDGGTSMSAKLTPETSGSIQFDVVDQDRLGSAEAEVAFVEIVDDTAPRVEFASQGIGTLITANAKIPGRLEARDDYGIAHLTAEFRLDLAVEQTAEPAADGNETSAIGTTPDFVAAAVRGVDTFEPGVPEFETDTLFDLVTAADAHRSLAANPDESPFRPGQLLALRFGAHDAFEPDAHITLSETVHFRIVTREKLLEELRRRQSERRRDLEALLKRERTLRAETAETTLPTDGDLSDAAAASRSRFASLARRQQAQGRRLSGIATRYQRILDEFLNNRLLEPNVVRGKHGKIVTPLQALAESDIPSTSAATGSLAESADEALRTQIIGGYDTIIRGIERVLEQMEQTEDLALLLEALRIVIKTEEQAADLVEKKRNESVDSLFGPDDPGNQPDDGRDNPRKEKR